MFLWCICTVRMQLLDGVLGVRRRQPGAAAAGVVDHVVRVAGGRRVGDPGGQGVPQRRRRAQHLLPADPRCQGASSSCVSVGVPILSYPARPRRRFLAACTWPPPRRCQLSCVHLDCSQTLMTNVARTDISSSKCIMATRNRAICQKKNKKTNKEKIDALHGTE